MQEVKGIDISDTLIELHQKGFTYRAIGKMFNVSYQTVWLWAQRKRHPLGKRQRQYALMLEDMLNVAASIPPLSGDPANHGGPPSNEFSWRATDPPLLKKTLNLMVRYAGVKSIRNREMMDTAGRYIRKIFQEYEVKKADAPMFALAALKAASLAHYVHVSLGELVTDREKFEEYLSEMAKLIDI